MNKNSASKALVIPAAGKSHDVYGRNISQSPALSIIGGKPLIRRILESYNLSLFQEIRIGANVEDTSALERICAPFKSNGARITIHSIVSSAGPVDTLKQLMNFVNADGVLINLGDTLCLDAMKATTHRLSAMVCAVDEVSRWAIAIRKEDGTLKEVLNKPQNLDDVALADALTGIYWSEEISLFRNLLATATELSDLLLSDDAQCQLVETKLWFDSDHLDRLATAQMSTFEAREFNTITMNPSRGSIQKSSNLKPDKIRSEIAYFRNLPTDLSAFFPRIFTSESGLSPFYELEFYPFPNLSELYSFRPPPIFFWKRLLRKISQEVLPAFTVHNPGAGDICESLTNALVSKAQERLHSILEAREVLEYLKQDSAIVNNIEVLGLRRLIEQSYAVVERMSSAQTVVHGDFCLSNMLYEPNYEILKLIDPRGGFKGDSIFGPSAYDVAKLSHSLLGRYDLIVNDLFSLSVTVANSQAIIQLNLLELDVHEKIAVEFASTFADFGYSQKELELMSALLLVSLVPFHLDKPERANAFLARGLYLGTLALQTNERSGGI